jgi:hypothetical protein
MLYILSEKNILFKEVHKEVLGSVTCAAARSQVGVHTVLEGNVNVHKSLRQAGVMLRSVIYAGTEAWLIFIINISSQSGVSTPPLIIRFPDKRHTNFVFIISL